MTAATDAPADGRLFAGPSGRLLLLVSVASMTLFVGQLALAPLLPAIVADLDITPAAAGVALSVMWGLVALCRFPGGRLADGLSHKTVLVASFGIAVLGFAVLAVATSYPALLLGLVAVGVGGGLYMPAAITLLSASFASRRSRALGVHELFINLGGVLAGLVAAAVLVLGGWNLAFLPVIGSLVLVAALTHRWADEPYVLSRVRLDLRATGARVIRGGPVRAVLVTFALLGFAWQGAAGFLPTFLQAEKAFPPTLASNAYTGLFVAGILANLVVTPFGDRLGPARVAAAAVLAGAVGLAAAIVGGHPAVVIAGIAAFGVGSASFWPVMTSYLMGLLPEETRGGDFGALSTVSLSVGSLGPAYVGLVAERRSFAVAYWGLVGCLLVGAAVSVWLARRPGPGGRDPGR